MMSASVRELRRARWESRAAHRNDGEPAMPKSSPAYRQTRCAPPGYRHWLAGLLVSMRP
jgi:hypothetical protein